MPNEPWDVICFSGEDTLVLTKFAQHVENYSDRLVPYVVHVEGRYVRDQSSANILGQPKQGETQPNHYIRNIWVEDICEQDEEKRRTGLSVGCSNATFEDIAADKVRYFFFGKQGHRQELIRETHFMFHGVWPLREYTVDDMRMQDNYDPPQYLKAIAIAKRLRSTAAVELLIDYMERPHFDANIKEITADAFRSMERLCMEHPEYSERATDAMMRHITSSISDPEYHNSVIYSIEALGFVANHNDIQKAKVCTYLSDLLATHKLDEFESNPLVYWHMVWASLVAAIRTMHKSLNTAPIFAINRSFLSDRVLAEIEPEETRSVIQRLMAEVIISRGGITLNEYLSIFGLDESDVVRMQRAGDKDEVALRKKLDRHVNDWIKREATPKLIKVAKDLTKEMACAILVGLVRAYLRLP